MRLSDLNTASREDFVAALGAVFEHSPWIAEASFDARPFETVEALHAAMLSAIENAADDAKLALIKAHPDLAGKAARAGALTEHSTREQSGAGLDRLSAEERDRFTELNEAYRARFGFPFVMAVKGRDKAEILAAFVARLQHDADTEAATALAEIEAIALLRLRDRLPAG